MRMAMMAITTSSSISVKAGTPGVVITIPFQSGSAGEDG